MINKYYEIIADGIIAIKKKYPKTQKAKQKLIDEVASSIEFELNINGKIKKGEMPITNYVYNKMKEGNDF